ncbi:F0F1 ATP synthase subunit A [Kineococcus rhizosphaerae]|uniref:ATP synthase subunit a n=1 Tax=Kineococcus rhizosphaerae TaxID=559628 RepID=A0A2T0QZ09_9ACTN|nr:F0F1 ATP synthase subunit A [Kineococcus rhizosphaerae]PRY11755.1 ATP synthase F0 subcomplex A subunit [Kineococcus rhizosphaerae]
MSLPLLAAAPSAYEAPDQHMFWQPLIGSGAFAITRPAIVFALSAVLIIWLLLAGTKRLAVVPGKKQMVVEAAYGFVRNSIGRDIIGSKEFLKFVPLLFTFFSVILVNNLFGVIPPIQYPTMSRIAFPLALTIFLYLTYHIVGIRKKGFAAYFAGVVPHGLPKPIVPLVFLLEVLSIVVIQPVTITLRLFGNMFAGHLILVLFISGAEYMFLHGGFGLKIVGIPTIVMAFALTLFEIFVEFLQAYVYTMLAATFIASALADEH